MRFGGIQKTSLIDFPDRVATVLFTAGCNLRCPYCHNWRLVIDPKGPFFGEEEALQTLESRKKFVTSVVITGGEPTMQPDLPAFVEELKERGFAVKLDTNGFFPDTLEKSLLHADYVALDVKTCPQRYELLGARDVSNWLRSIEMLKEGDVEYEFRSTVVPGIVDFHCLQEMGALVRGARLFVLQQFVPGDTLDKSLRTTPYSPKTIECFAETIRPYVEKVEIRA